MFEFQAENYNPQSRARSPRLNGKAICCPPLRRRRRRSGRETSLDETPACQRVQVLDARPARTQKSREGSVVNLLVLRNLRYYAALGRMVRILLGLVARLFVTCADEGVNWFTNK